jgi:L-amino acid N-acyltransferase
MISIRPATEADLPQILEIYNEVIHNTTAVFQYKPHTPEMHKVWFDTKRAQDMPVFVAEEHQAIIGLSTFGPFRAWAAYKYTVENSVYVRPGQQRKGIGRQLMTPLIAAAKQKNMHAVIASIEASNLASLKLHAAFGFEEVAHFKQVGYKFGRWLDLKFLELMLETPQNPVDG